MAIGSAGSAAANLLTLGDYAITYPTASIHFHGVRFSEVDIVTVESAATMASQLRNSNYDTAAKLASAGAERLAFNYARLKPDFPKAAELTTGSDIERFALVLKDKLSYTAETIVDKALYRWRSRCELSEKVLAIAAKSHRNGNDFEAKVLKEAINFETRKNKKNPEWILGRNGIYQIVNDFLLLRDYDMGRHVHLTDRILARFGPAFLTDEECQLIEQTDERGSLTAVAQRLKEDKLNQVIKPFCYFSASIWQSLQEDENPLSPKDAYWLGAIDEVLGSGLPCLREIAEAETPAQENLPVVSTS